MAAIVVGSLKPKYAGSYRMVAVEDGKPFDDKPYKDWIDADYKNRGFGKASNIPVHLFPKTLQFTRGKRLFDYNAYCPFGPALSTRLKDLIETIEPGVHQFVPVEVLHKDGTPYGEPFWLYSICTKIDAINPVKGGVMKAPGWNFDKDPDAYYWDIKSGGDEYLAVYKDGVAGRAMWRDLRYSTAQFFSDALLEGMRAQKMEGWEILTYWEEI